MALPQGLDDFTLADKAALIIGAEHPAGHVAAVTLAEAGAKLMIASQEPGTSDQINETVRDCPHASSLSLRNCGVAGSNPPLD